jgi:hypothetical protein
MPEGRRLGAEQIVTKLRQIEVLHGEGKSLATACKEAGTTEQSSIAGARSSAASTSIRRNALSNLRMRTAG